MRRKKKRGIRTNQTIKYCTTCARKPGISIREQQETNDQKKEKEEEEEEYIRSVERKRTTSNTLRIKLQSQQEQAEALSIIEERKRKTMCTLKEIYSLYKPSNPLPANTHDLESARLLYKMRKRNSLGNAHKHITFMRRDHRHTNRDDWKEIMNRSKWKEIIVADINELESYSAY